MNLYIKIEDGIPVGHPALEENLTQVFGGVPVGWEPFVRAQVPALDKYEVLDEQLNSYAKVNGVWTDVWGIRNLTPEEHIAQRQELINAVKERRAKHHPYALNFSAWVLNEETLVFEPPFPKPDDGKFYRWSGPNNNWKEAPPFPDDGKKYYFDFDNWVNVEITE